MTSEGCNKCGVRKGTVNTPDPDHKDHQVITVCERCYAELKAQALGLKR